MGRSDAFEKGESILVQSRPSGLTARMRSLWRLLLLKGSWADRIAALVVIALPWSTTATGVLVVVWLITLALKPDAPGLSKSLSSPSGYLPVALVALAVAGTFWSDVSITEKLQGLRPYYKLLAIPLLIMQFRCSENGRRVLIGFLASCGMLLALSFASAIWPPVAWWRPGNPGVPMKDQIAQSAEFVICAFCLLHVSMSQWRAGRSGYSIVALALSLLFLANVLLVATSRTELVVIALLSLLFLIKEWGWKSLPLGLLTIIALASIVWVSSSYLRGRIAHGIWEVDQYESSDRPTSIGLRLEWWQKSLGFIEQAPVFGNGTGSIPKLFRDSALGKVGASGVPIDNPHNQIFAIAIPLGALGTIMLFSMWIAHALLFRENTAFGWFGSVVVAQNVVGCIFNSHLFDFTEGWIYVLGVGIIGGSILSERAAAAASGWYLPAMLPEVGRDKDRGLHKGQPRGN